jgi:SAM-dependent methyltransferase
MTVCRACSNPTLRVIKSNDKTRWVLCQRCFYLHRILEPDYEYMFIDNTVYEWGTAAPNWSSELFSRQVDAIGGEWEFFCSKITSIPARVLDFGSGTGPLLEYLKNQNIDSIGVELSKTNSSFSQAKGHQVIHKIPEKALPEIGRFNIVHLQNSGTYIRDILYTFQAFNQLLVDDGYIFWQDKVYNWSRYRAGAHMILSPGGPAALFSKVFLHNLLAMTGFRIVFFESQFGHYRLVAQKTNANVPLRGNFRIEWLHVKTLSVLDKMMPVLHILSRVKRRLIGSK